MSQRWCCCWQRHARYECPLACQGITCQGKMSQAAVVAGGGRGCPRLPFIPMNGSSGRGLACNPNHSSGCSILSLLPSLLACACWYVRLGNDAAGCSDESPWFPGHAQHQCRTSIQLHTVCPRAIKPSGTWGRSRSQPSRPTGTVGCFLFSGRATCVVHTFTRRVQLLRADWTVCAAAALVHTYDRTYLPRE